MINLDWEFLDSYLFHSIFYIEISKKWKSYKFTKNDVLTWEKIKDFYIKNFLWFKIIWTWIRVIKDNSIFRIDVEYWNNILRLRCQSLWPVMIFLKEWNNFNYKIVYNEYFEVITDRTNNFNIPVEKKSFKNLSIDDKKSYIDMITWKLWHN